MGFIWKLAGIVILICILFFVCMSPAPVRTALKMLVVGVVKLPLEGTSAAAKELPEIFYQGRIHKENKLLKEKLGILERKVLELQEASKENERLRGLLNFKSQAKHRAYPALVIARDASSYSDIMIINKGSRNSIKQDMAVVSSEGLIGRVSEVGRDASKVILISDPNFRCAALIERTREQGIIEGTLWGNCRLKFLTLDADVKLGDIVITSGLGGSIPKGILVGKVVSIKPEISYLTKSAYIKPAADITKLEEVLCVE
ncbi:MAG: rod shape-determining protein MreC [Candidatus Omnitrophota bacterium]